MNHRVYNKAAWRLRYPFCKVAETFLSYGKTWPVGCGFGGSELFARHLDKVLNVPMAADFELTPISMLNNVPFPQSGRDSLSFFSLRCW